MIPADPDRSSLSPRKRARLVEFLSALPASATTRLFGALESDQARGGVGLPHGFLLEILRREIVGRDLQFPTRPNSAERIFFEPFEDFFVAFRAGRKRRARIARSSIAAIWSLLMSDPAAAGAARAASALEAAIRKNAPDSQVFKEALFAAVGEGIERLLAHADADAAFRADLIDRLGGADGFEDFREINLLFAAVPQLRLLQAAFPRPVLPLTEEELFEARRLYAIARNEAPDAAPYLLLALMGRMEAPWKALPLYYHLSQSRDGALGPAHDEAAIMLEALLDDVEGLARLLERDAEVEFEAADANLHLAHFVAFAEGLAGEAARAGDRAVLNRIEAARDVGAGALERFTEQSLAALRRAMPVRHAGGSSRLMALRPDFARPLPPRAANAARQAAAFLAGAAATAEQLRRPEAGAHVFADAIDEARRYAGDLVLEIRAAEGEDRLAARRLMEHTLDIAEPLLPADEIGLLRERAKAAAMTA